MRTHSRQTSRPHSNAALFRNTTRESLHRCPLLHVFTKIAIIDAQKITANAIKRSGRSEVLMIILVQLGLGVQSNLVQHPREIHHSTRHLFRALWISRHARQSSAREIVQGQCLVSWTQLSQTRSTNQKPPSSTTIAEHAGTQRSMKTGFARSFQMIGSATAATMI
jgi:hypothetical protein